MKSTTTVNNSEKVAKILFESGAIVFRPKQPFRFASGILSPIYVDNRRLISLPQERKKIINYFVELIDKIGIPDVIAGTATAGIPHAAWIAEKLNLPMVYVRSEAKKHGKENQVEGIIRRGQKVLVVEDLISTGGSSIAVVAVLKKMGAKVTGVVAIYSHTLQAADDNFKKAKLPLHYLTDLKTTAQIAKDNNFLKDGQMEMVMDWAKDPQTWGTRSTYKVSKPVYNLNKSWEDNYKDGPNFDGPYPEIPKEKKWKFLGHDLISPVGVAAGPLPNAKWLIPYLKLGYGSVVQKTVRSSAHKSHPYPNILTVDIKGTLDPLSEKPLVGHKDVDKPLATLSITNSFGNPCYPVDKWTKETIKTKKAKTSGQLFGVSVYGTSEENTTLEELAEDYAKTAALAKQAGADFIEANLACPNVSGSENPFLYKDAKAVAAISKAIKRKIGKTPLVLKVGYFESYKNLQDVLKKSKGNFEAVSAINTISKKIVDRKGKQALPGRDVSGVCGFAIKKYGIKMVRSLKKAQKDLKMKFEIIGVGGAMATNDITDYLKAGANHVHSATAVMWNPYLAYEFNSTND